MAQRRLELIYDTSDDALTEYDEMSNQIEALSRSWKPGSVGQRYFAKFAEIVRGNEVRAQQAKKKPAKTGKRIRKLN